MPVRFTPEMLRAALENLRATIGPSADKWTLNYYSSGGGYRVETEGSGETPLGSARQKAEPMYHTLHACRLAITVYEASAKEDKPAPPAPRYRLYYAALVPTNGGTYEAKGGTEFGTETDDDGIFEAEAEALETFVGYIHENADGATVENITEKEGFAGWGTVLRITERDNIKSLYTVTVSRVQ